MFGFVVCLMTGCADMFAESLIHANRQPLMADPSNYGMLFKNISFQTTDSVLIKGWHIPGNKSVTAIITHPMNFTRYGYSIKNQGRFKITDIEVEFLKTAKHLHEKGYHVIMFDLRNHGESSYSSDSIFGLGVFEWYDVLGCLDYIANSSELSRTEIVFVSFCTGANATIIAMNHKPEKFEKVKCIAAIQPISTGVFVNNFMNDKYPLLKGMIPKIEKACLEKGGLPWGKMSPEEYMNGIIRPVFIVQGEHDPWTDVDFVKKLYALAPEPKELFVIPGITRRFQTYNYFGDNPEKLLAFIKNHLESE
jgi:esterase/lipase